MSAFFCKKSTFFGQNSTFTQSSSLRTVSDFLFLFSVFVRQKVTINEDVSFTDYASGIRLPDCTKLAVNWKNGNGVTIFWNGVIVKIFNVAWFLLSSLVTGPNFMSISSMVLELWQFPFIRDWPEIRKSEIPPSEFCSISGDWGELGTLSLAITSLKICYRMLQMPGLQLLPFLS